MAICCQYEGGACARRGAGVGVGVGGTWEEGDCEGGEAWVGEY